jgi:hypothetical protein
MEFKDIFYFFQPCASEDPAENLLHEEGLKPIDLKITCDMACHMHLRRVSFWVVENPKPCDSLCRQLHKIVRFINVFTVLLMMKRIYTKKVEEIESLKEIATTTYGEDIHKLSKL